MCNPRRLRAADGIFVLSCCISLSGGLSSDAATSEVEDIVNTHRSMCASLRSFHVKIESFAPRPPEGMIDRFAWVMGPARQLVLFNRGEWFVDNDREKILFLPFEQTHRNDLPINILEAILVDDRAYILENWDRNHPQVISPSRQGSVRAQIRLRTSDFAWRDPAQSLILKPRFDLSAPRLGLPNFVARFQNQSISSEDEQQATIRLSGDSEGIVQPSEFVEVTISKQHGFMITRLARLNEGASRDAEMLSNWSKMEYIVKEFRDCGSGIFMPVDIEYWLTDPTLDEPLLMSRYKVEMISVNEPFPSETFVMSFPENVVVIDDRVTDPMEVKWFLWGADNTPFWEVHDHGQRMTESVPVFDASLSSL